MAVRALAILIFLLHQFTMPGVGASGAPGSSQCSGFAGLTISCCTVAAPVSSCTCLPIACACDERSPAAPAAPPRTDRPVDQLPAPPPARSVFGRPGSERIPPEALMASPSASHARAQAVFCIWRT